MTVLIPAYKPDQKLILLLKELKAECDYDIIVVDDGGGEEFKPVFDEVAALGVTLLTHEVNRGKGAALKTGFEYIAEHFDCGCVTADADGQHLVKDIIAVAKALEENPECLILGSRAFDKNVPWRSKAGNICTRIAFNLLNSYSIGDTQTGLRGIPKGRLEEYTLLEGDRYEYEMRMLLTARERDIEIKEVIIDTVYIEENASSHFNPVKDALRVFLPVLLHGGSMFLALILDLVLFCILNALNPSFVAVNFCLCWVAAAIVRGIGLLIQRKFKMPRKEKLLDFLWLNVCLLAITVSVTVVLAVFLNLPAVPAKIISGFICFIIMALTRGRALS